MDFILSQGSCLGPQPLCHRGKWTFASTMLVPTVQNYLLEGGKKYQIPIKYCQPVYMKAMPPFHSSLHRHHLDIDLLQSHEPEPEQWLERLHIVPFNMISPIVHKHIGRHHGVGQLLPLPLCTEEPCEDWERGLGLLGENSNSVLKPKGLGQF